MTGLNECHFLCVEGSTGCGKSSQIPCYIYEDFSVGKTTTTPNIMVLQPRVIAAKSLGDYVNTLTGWSPRQERSVGYIVGGDKCAGVFCNYVTYEWFLQYFSHGMHKLEDYTHIILDEVHETSFVLELVFVLLGTFIQKVDNGTLKLVLMSASRGMERWAAYFWQKFKIGTDNALPITIAEEGHQVDVYYCDLKPAERENFEAQFGADAWDALAEINKKIQGPKEGVLPPVAKNYRPPAIQFIKALVTLNNRAFLVYISCVPRCVCGLWTSEGKPRCFDGHSNLDVDLRPWSESYLHSLDIMHSKSFIQSVHKHGGARRSLQLVASGPKATSLTRSADHFRRCSSRKRWFPETTL